jgi:hypothetical protein
MTSSLVEVVVSPKYRTQFKIIYPVLPGTKVKKLKLKAENE